MFRQCRGIYGLMALVGVALSASMGAYKENYDNLPLDTERGCRCHVKTEDGTVLEDLFVIKSYPTPKGRSKCHHLRDMCRSDCDRAVAEIANSKVPLMSYRYNKSLGFKFCQSLPSINKDGSPVVIKAVTDLKDSDCPMHDKEKYGHWTYKLCCRMEPGVGSTTSRPREQVLAWRPNCDGTIVVYA